MEIHMFIRWYGRKPDFSADYADEYHGTITGNTPDECMKKFNAYRENHDLSKFTRMEIEFIY